MTTPSDALANQVEQWAPAVPIAELHEDCQKAAAKLQRAQKVPLERRNDVTLSAAEFEQLGIAAYAVEFGHRISARHFRRLLKRTLWRDRGAQNWSRIEIYLPDRLRRSRGAVIAAILDPSEIMQGMDETGALKPGQEAAFWRRVCLAFHSRATTAELERPLRPQLFEELTTIAPWLASRSRDALRVQFNRRYTNWLDGQDLVDGRHNRKGRTSGKPLDEKSVDKAAWHALRNCGGRISQAVRELSDDDSLDPIFLELIKSPRRSKSEFNRRVRQAVRNKVAIAAPFFKDRRTMSDTVPPLDLTYDAVTSMMCVQADDFTMPVHFWVAVGDWYSLTRGQLLLYIDWRTLFIVGYCLSPEPQYNSRLIRTGFVRVFDKWGLPEVLYLERGIWKNSKLITGAQRTTKSNAGALLNVGAKESEGAMSWPEIETGLGQFGIEFIHAIRPRSKPVERVGALLQDLMEGEPGYCGRDERRDCPERTRKQKLLVESRKKHPQDLGLYGLDAWDARFKQLCDIYNGTPQEGKRLQGLSPSQAFDKFWRRPDGPTKFGPEHRFLLAHHKAPVTVRAKDGLIKFKLNGEEYRYCDEQTGSRPGQHLLAWLNIDDPDVCTFTDLDMQQPFNVMRQPKTNGLRYDGSYTTAIEQVHSTVKPRKALFRTMEAEFEPTFRRTVAPAVVNELGQTIESGRTAANESHRFETRARQAFESIGVPFRGDATAEQVEAAERMAERRRHKEGL